MNGHHGRLRATQYAGSSTSHSLGIITTDMNGFNIRGVAPRPSNTISGNKSDNGGGSIDSVSGDTSAGVLITGASANTRVYVNFIGLFQFPAGGSPIGSLDTGNAGNFFF